MCLIILKKKDAVIPLEHLRTGYAQNNDGWGLAYCDEQGVVKVKKAVTGVSHFLEVYEDTVKRYPTSPVLVHFRLATHGARDSSMCHPFYAGNGAVAVAHNGILTDYSTSTGKGDHLMSDTARFIARRLNPLLLCTEWSKLYEEEWRANLGKEIGSFNKLALLTVNGGYVIVNAEHGHWKDEVWYSNHGYEDRVVDCYDGWHTRRARMREFDYASVLDDDGGALVDTHRKVPLDTSEDRSGFRKFEPGMLECDLCNDHIKGAFYIERAGDGLFVYCEECMISFNEVEGGSDV